MDQINSALMKLSHQSVNSNIFVPQDALFRCLWETKAILVNKNDIPAIHAEYIKFIETIIRRKIDPAKLAQQLDLRQAYADEAKEVQELAEPQVLQELKEPEVQEVPKSVELETTIVSKSAKTKRTKNPKSTTSTKNRKSTKAKDSKIPVSRVRTKKSIKTYKKPKIQE